MLIEADFVCAYCGEANAASVDPSAGRKQSYTEDCQICCRPNLLYVELEADEEGSLSALIDAQAEMDLS